MRKKIILVIYSQEIENMKYKNAEVLKYINGFKIYKHNLRYDLLAIKEHGNKKVNKHWRLTINADAKVQQFLKLGKSTHYNK